MRFARWPVLTTVFIASSCGPAAQKGASGGFETPAPNGQFPVTLVETQSTVLDDTVSLIAGREEGVGLRAYAGIIPDQPVQSDLTGNATFTGPYAVAFIEDIAITDNFVRGRNSLLRGTITLDADLSTLSFSGTDQVLTVDAQIRDDNVLDGQVTVLGVAGTLQGEIGEDRAFGAFHGADETHLMSGGFVSYPAP